MFFVSLVVADPAWCETKRLALLVSNHSGGEGLAQLRYAERDATRLQEVLQEVGGFSSDDVVLLRDEESPDFLQALADLERRSQTYQAQGFETVLLVYYSGHAENGMLRMGESKMPMGLLRIHLENSNAQVRLAFIDSCGAGAISEKGGRKAPPFLFHVDDKLQARGQVIIASSSSDEVSQESDEVQGSFFTHYLVSGMRGDADENKNGKVTLDEAYRYAYRRTVAATSNTRSGAQHPTYDYHIKGAGDVVLTQFSLG
ncbi:MAG: caspase family protein [Deltaproteobacteria bacterium]|nr:caspase family protein [Deltaproteobacteria bacterium]